MSDNMSSDDEVPIGHDKFSQLFIFGDTKKTAKRRYVKKSSSIKTGTWVGDKTVLKKSPPSPDGEQLANLKRLQQISELKRKKKELVAEKHFTCEECEKAYTRQYTLNQHMKTKHAPLKK